MNDLLLIILSFFIAFALFPYFIRKFKEKEITVEDGDRNVPTEGGLVVIIIYLSLLSLFSLFGFEFNYAPIMVLALFAVFGLFYDLTRIPPYLKICIPILFSFPLFSLLSGNVYTYFLAPLYIMVTANLVHMHSDHNGMPVYTSLIVMASMIAIAFRENALENIRFILPLFGISLAFSYYNFYPSQIFQGNIGAMLGSSLGIIIILQGLEFIGLVMLFPHIINFLIYLYWRIRRVPHMLYARVHEDGTLEVPKPLTLKWVLPYYFRITEKDSILFIHVLTALFCSIGILLEV
jgi:UDP-N-acetylglucosamine--dolichyl-phosphate N-acetylglucosaminephosphotransferase